MAKKKNRGNGARPKRCQICNRKSHPFKQNAAEIKGWLNRMEMFVDKGLTLSHTLDGRTLNEKDDLFWALVKYIENIQECVIKLDDMNCSILRALAEIPIKSETGVDLNWKGIKGMRNVLAHEFWQIDRDTLWTVATEDLPVLKYLLAALVIGDSSGAPSVPLRLRVPVRKLRGLPPFEPRATFTAGCRIIGLYFDDGGIARCMRIGVADDRTLVMEPSETLSGMDLTINLLGNHEPEELGHWSNLTLPAINDDR
jgi:uncharacterized protein with HEPN domain